MLINFVASIFLPILADAWMVGLGVILIILGPVAYTLGARGLIGLSADLGRTLLIVFIIAGIVTLILGC